MFSFVESHKGLAKASVLSHFMVEIKHPILNCVVPLFNRLGNYLWFILILNTSLETGACVEHSSL